MDCQVLLSKMVYSLGAKNSATGVYGCAQFPWTPSGVAEFETDIASAYGGNWSFKAFPGNSCEELAASHGMTLSPAKVVDGVQTYKATPK